MPLFQQKLEIKIGAGERMSEKSHLSNLVTEYEKRVQELRKAYQKLDIALTKWFLDNYPHIGIDSIDISDNPFVCEVITVKPYRRLPADVINSFCNEFQLDVSIENYSVRREHGRTAIADNPHVDFERWSYHFKVRI